MGVVFGRAEPAVVQSDRPYWLPGAEHSSMRSPSSKDLARDARSFATAASSSGALSGRLPSSNDLLREARSGSGDAHAVHSQPMMIRAATNKELARDARSDTHVLARSLSARMPTSRDHARDNLSRHERAHKRVPSHKKRAWSTSHGKPNFYQNQSWEAADFEGGLEAWEEMRRSSAEQQRQRPLSESIVEEEYRDET